MGPILGIFGGAIPLYWASRELWVVWRATPKSKLIKLLLGSHVKATPGIIAQLRIWFGLVTIVELLVVVASLLLIFFPRRHYAISSGLLAATAVGFGLMYEMPYKIGTTILFDGLIVCPFLAFLAGISGLVFRSDIEFARAYGLD